MLIIGSALSDPVADIKFELEVGAVELEQASQRLSALREARDGLIRSALRAGVRPSEVARLTSLTRARIAQLR